MENSKPLKPCTRRGCKATVMKWELVGIGDGDYDVKEEVVEGEELGESNPVENNESKTTARKIEGTGKLYPCSHKNCNKQFTLMSSFNRHIKLVHNKERPFTCKLEGCLKSFYNKHRLECHQRSAGHGKEKLECTYGNCFKKFSSKQRRENL